MNQATETKLMEHLRRARENTRSKCDVHADIAKKPLQEQVNIYKTALEISETRNKRALDEIEALKRWIVKLENVMREKP